MDHRLPTFWDAFQISIIATIAAYVFFRVVSLISDPGIRNSTIKAFIIIFLGGLFTWVYFYFYYLGLSKTTKGFSSIHIYCANLTARLSVYYFLIYFIAKKIYYEIRRSIG